MKTKTFRSFIIAAIVLATSVLLSALAMHAARAGAAPGQAPRSPNTDVSGDILTDTVWTLAGSPYHLASDVTVNPGVTLTVQAGVVVMGEASAELRVLGRLSAWGTATQPITFTSALDTAPDQWQGLVFDGGAASGDLRHVTVRYAGAGNSILGEGSIGNGSNIIVRNVQAGELRLSGCAVLDEHALDPYYQVSFIDFGVYALNSRVVVSGTLFSGDGDWPNDMALYAAGATTAVTVTDSIFQNNAGNAIYASGIGSLQVTGSLFQGNGNWALGLGVDDLNRLTQSDNTVTGNGVDRLALSGGTLADGAHLNLNSFGGRTGYVLDGYLVVPAGVTLTVDPGVQIMGQAVSELQVFGRLVAIGTPSQPITFTSSLDSGPQQWEGLVFDGNQASGDLRHVTVRYGGNTNSVFAGWPGSNISVRNVQAGEVRLSDCAVLDERSYLGGYEVAYVDYGLYATNSRVVVSDTLFSGNGDRTNDFALVATGAGSAITVTDSTFQNNAGSAIYTDGVGRLQVTGSLFQGNGGWALGVGLGDLEVLTQSGNTSSGNGIDPLALVSGPVQDGAHLSPVSFGGHSGYVLPGYLVVPAGVTLTVDPGVQIMGQAVSELQVFGRLVAIGTPSQPITFTSSLDSGPQQWEGLVFDGNQASGDLRHVTVRYGGNTNSVFAGWPGSNISVRNVQAGEVRLSDCAVLDERAYLGGYEVAFVDYGLYALNSRIVVSDTLFSGNGDRANDFALAATGAGSAITVTDSTFQNNAGSAIYTDGVGRLQVTGSLFQGNGGWALGVGLGDLEVLTQSGNTSSGNGIDPLALMSGTVEDGAHLSPVSFGGHSGYVLPSYLVVPAGVTLTVDPGVQVMGQAVSELQVFGRLVAIGTPSQPITFTSSLDSGPQQWEGLVFDGNQASGDLRHVTVRYGGNTNSVFAGWPGSNISVRDVQAGEVRLSDCAVLDERSYLGGYEYAYVDYGLYATNSRVVVSDTLFSGNGDRTNDYALVATGASSVLTVTNSTFQNNAGSGLAFFNGSHANITGSTIRDNPADGIQSQNSTVVVESSNLLNNLGFGVENLSATPVVHAIYNWWGHPSGPYHPIYNPQGLANPVSDNVSFAPWLEINGVRQAIPLTLDQPVTGAVKALEYADYSLATSAGQALLVQVTPTGGSGSLWVFSRSTSLPTWTRYELRTQDLTPSGAYVLLIPSAQDGTTYFSIFGYNVAAGGGNFQIQVETAGRQLTNVIPHTAGNAGQISLQIAGMPFVEGMSVRLYGSGRPTLSADAVTLQSAASLEAHFELTRTAVGLYDVVAVWPDAQTAALLGAFNITAGSGPHLEASIEAPPSVRADHYYTLWVEVANTGDADMPIPLLSVSSPISLPMRLNNQKPFQQAPQQVMLAAGNGSNTLSPGASLRFPVIFDPIFTWDRQVLDFFMSLLPVGSQPIDWNLVESQLQPPDMDPAVWSVLWPTLADQIGSTWADYNYALSLDATYLSVLGRQVSDVRDLFRYEVLKAMGMNPHDPLAGRQEAYAPAPGIPLQFTLTFPGSLEGRFYLGPLGRGWSHSYDIFLEIHSSGNVLVHLPGSSYRLFTHNPDGSYVATPGDFGVLAVNGGLFELTEKDGLRYRFRPDNKLDYFEDPNGNRISLTYNGNGQLAVIQHSNGDHFSLAYNPQGRIASLTDQAGLVTQYAYDASGEHLLTATAPGNRITSYSYNPPAGNAADHALLSITYPDGKHTYYAYDAQGRLTDEHQDGNQQRKTYAYATNGTITITDANGSTALLSPDEYGRPTRARDPLHRKMDLKYGADSNLSEMTDPAGGSYDFSYDSWGNVISLNDPQGNRVTMGHDNQFNQLTYLKDARGNRTTFTYDTAGNLSKLTYADASQELIANDAAGNPTQLTRRSGDVITYTRNSQGQVLRKDYPDGAWVAYTYDAAGNQTSAEDANGVITMQYNPNTNLLTHISYPSGHAFTFSYDPAGRRTQRLGEDGYALNYHYDLAGRLDNLSDGSGATLVQYTYDAAGRLLHEAKGNGTSTAYAYDAAGQLTQLVNYAPDHSVQSHFDYTYDLNGRRTSMTTLEGATTYEYDLTGQLTGVTYPGGRHVIYVYDMAGNRVTVSDDGTATAYSANNMNQYTQAGDATYTYDLNGNLASRTDASGVAAYQYDFENRLVSVSGPGSETWSYTYDALGNRVSAEHNGVVTEYVNDPEGMVYVAAEYDGAGALAARYVQGMGLVARISASGDPAYYAFDAIGSTRQVSNAAGAVVNSYDYDPFGVSLQSDETLPNPFRYVGRFGVMNDDSRLTYMRSRFYDPRLGRFFQSDPAGILGGLNVYTYALNSPVNAIDPLGMRPRWGDFFSGLGTTIGGVVGILGSAFAEPVTFGASTIGVVASAYAIGVGVGNMYSALTGDAPVLEGGILGDLFKISPNRNIRNIGKALDVLMPGNKNLKLLNIRPKLLYYHEVAKTASDVNTLLNILIEDGIQIAHGTTTNITSHDPNEKIGPEGVGDQRQVSGAGELNYEIYFENAITATAPAQAVVITDYLDPDLDWTSLRLAEIAWGDQVVTIPENAVELTARLTVQDYRPEVKKSWWVDVSTELNPLTGRLRWTLRMLDPDTGLPPEDPLAGFLPPNDAAGRGEGHVSFSVRPKAALTQGTLLTNTASIVFDTNPAIETNQVWNTIGVFADLGLGMTGSPAEVKVGQFITYTLLVANHGPNPAAQGTLTDTLPVSVTLSSISSSQGGCSGTRTLTCDLGTLEPGSQATLTLVVRVNAAGRIENTAVVTSAAIDSRPEDNTATAAAQATYYRVFLPVTVKK